jgi:chromosome partitioning protein
MAGRVISITQQKGGSGKTTISAHLAVALASGGASVAILDVDPQGSLGEWFEKRERTLGEEGTGVTFRTASGWGAKREAKALARDHDIVVIDTPPKSDLEARHAIEAADLVIVPVQPTPVDVWATAATLQMIAREGRPSLLVVNRVPPRAALTGQMLEAVAALGWTAAQSHIGNRIAFAESMGGGSTVNETEPAGKAAAEILGLTSEVLAKLAGEA